jgi:hypothetical protein
MFQALGNLYFAHETLKDVLIWDFKGIFNIIFIYIFILIIE